MDAFLEAADTGAALATNGADPAASVAAAYLSQLKRVQREMRGLPPMMPEVSELSGGKKIKFDDGDINMDADEGQAVEAAPAGVPLYANGKINKEERKRLKKERRKAEKNKGDVEEED